MKNYEFIIVWQVACWFIWLFIPLIVRFVFSTSAFVSISKKSKISKLKVGYHIQVLF